MCASIEKTQMPGYGNGKTKCFKQKKNPKKITQQTLWNRGNNNIYSVKQSVLRVNVRRACNKKVYIYLTFCTIALKIHYTAPFDCAMCVYRTLILFFLFDLCVFRCFVVFFSSIFVVLCGVERPNEHI